MEILAVIPESTRKDKGGEGPGLEAPTIPEGLSSIERDRLRALREEIRTGSPLTNWEPNRLLPAYLRFQGNMYRRIPREAWENRHSSVEILIVSGFYGLLDSSDPVVRYEHSMAEATAPFGKLNRWWHERGLATILAAYVQKRKPRVVVDLLSREYREAVAGFEHSLTGIRVETIDFPGLGRGSQPKRGEKITQILTTGKI